MSNYFVNISHIPSHMLTDFCKTFDLNIVLYSIDEKGRLRKANDKNGTIKMAVNLAEIIHNIHLH